MNTSLVSTVGLRGIQPIAVKIIVVVGPGKGQFDISGVSDVVARETRVRVCSALAHCFNVLVGSHSIAVSVSPENPHAPLDLPIAIGLLAALGQLPTKPSNLLTGVSFLGELTLSGDLRPIRGLVPLLSLPSIGSAFIATNSGIDFNPAARVYEAKNLIDVVHHLRGSKGLPMMEARSSVPVAESSEFDVSDLPASLVRTLEIAAAGGHNLILAGPVGSGKMMAARRLLGILPLLTREESHEVSNVHSAAGLSNSLVRTRPFRAPHHTVSAMGLLGGGSPVRPGELSLAHLGVLCLDELAEFSRTTLAQFRSALAADSWSVVSKGITYPLPGRPLVVGTIYECPCGHRKNGVLNSCGCSVERITQYRNRVYDLAPWADIHATMSPWNLMATSSHGESSEVVRARVVAARALQHRHNPGGELNADLGGPTVPRVARTIANLAGIVVPTAEHIEEARTLCA